MGFGADGETADSGLGGTKRVVLTGRGTREQLTMVKMAAIVSIGYRIRADAESLIFGEIVKLILTVAIILVIGQCYSGYFRKNGP